MNNVKVFQSNESYNIDSQIESYAKRNNLNPIQVSCSCSMDRENYGSKAIYMATVLFEPIKQD